MARKPKPKPEPTTIPVTTVDAVCVTISNEQIAALQRRVSILAELADSAWHWLSTGGPTSNSDRFCVNEMGKRIVAEVCSAMKAGLYNPEN